MLKEVLPGGLLTFSMPFIAIVDYVPLEFHSRLLSLSSVLTLVEEPMLSAVFVRHDLVNELQKVVTPLNRIIPLKAQLRDAPQLQTPG